MLTPSDIKNISNFENLNINHKRVFKHRLIKKCIQFQDDLEIVLLNHKNLGLKIDKVVNIEQLLKIIELYGELVKLQNM